jgi:ketosteroid isomerase-like protein
VWSSSNRAFILPILRSLYQSLFEKYKVKGNGELIEAEVSGDLGYFWIAYTLTAMPIAGGEPIEEQGKSVFIIRRQQDNSWKIARLIDNSDRAPNNNC